MYLRNATVERTLARFFNNENRNFKVKIVSFA